MQCKTGNTMHSQHGAVMVIALVLLMVLTVIGVTAMNTSTLEEKMASNMVSHDTAFQAAESVVENALDDVDTLANAIGASSATTVNMTFTDSNLTSSASISYLGAGLAYGFSLGENNSSFSNYRFDVTADAAFANHGAATTISQGVGRIGPKL